MIRARRLDIDVPDGAYLSTCVIPHLGIGVLNINDMLGIPNERIEVHFTTAHLGKLEELVEGLKAAQAAQLADNAAKAQAIAEHHQAIDVKG